MRLERLDRVAPPDVHDEHRRAPAQRAQDPRVEVLHAAAQVDPPQHDQVAALDLDLEVRAHRRAQDRGVGRVRRGVADGAVRGPGAESVEEARGERARDLPHVARVGELEDPIPVEAPCPRGDHVEGLVPGRGAELPVVPDLRVQQPLGPVHDLVVGRRLAAQGPLTPAVRRVPPQAHEAPRLIRLQQDPARIRAVEGAGAGLQGHGRILARPGNGTGADRALRDRPRWIQVVGPRPSQATSPSVSSIGL